MSFLERLFDLPAIDPETRPYLVGGALIAASAVLMVLAGAFVRSLL